jgi:hypothetical protein
MGVQFSGSFICHCSMIPVLCCMSFLFGIPWLKMNFTQKYALVQLLEGMAEGTEYPSSSWPLHVTVADTFAVDWDKNDLRKKLEQLLASLKPATAVGDHDEFFGPEKQTHVTILDMSKELVELHYKVVELLESAGAVFNDPQYAKEGFKAHATIQPHARVNKGDDITFNALTIIDMFPNSDPYQRKILKTMKIGYAR